MSALTWATAFERKEIVAQLQLVSIAGLRALIGRHLQFVQPDRA